MEPQAVAAYTFATIYFGGMVAAFITVFWIEQYSDIYPQTIHERYLWKDAKLAITTAMIWPIGLPMYVRAHAKHSDTMLEAMVQQRLNHQKDDSIIRNKL